MRARNVKPGLFRNEDLGDLGDTAILLFVALSMVADREGRLEDRPRRISAEVFPYKHGFDVETMLSDLHDRGFILRYEAGGQRLIQVVNFKKHQSPHPSEKKSILPAPSTIPPKTLEPTETQLGSNLGPTLSNIGNHPDSPILRFSDSPNPDSKPIYAAPKKRHRKNPTCLPEDFSPSEAHQNIAKELGVDIADQLKRFRLYWVKERRADWDKTFRNWLLNARPKAKTAQHFETITEQNARRRREYDQQHPAEAPDDPSDEETIQ